MREGRAGTGVSFRLLDLLWQFEEAVERVSTRHAEEAAEKVTPNAFLAAHGAAPQRQINHLRLLWRGAMPCERLFQHPLSACPAGTRPGGRARYGTATRERAD